MPENRLEVQQTQRLSQHLQTTIHLLACDLDELSEEIQKAVEENPALEAVPPQKVLEDVSVRVKTRLRSTRSGYSAPEPVAAAMTTMDDLEQQLRLLNLDETTRRAAKAMLRMLSPKGYFPQEPEAFARESGVPEDVARRALAAVQSLEPTGVGARTLTECLELQLREKPGVDPLCFTLIRQYLIEIGKGNLRAIARGTGASMALVSQCVDVIRTLAPSPCSLDEGEVRYIIPEFSVEMDEGERLTVQFYNDYYPTLRLDEHFSQLAEELDGEERTFARRMLSSAKRMLQAVDLRQSTMERLAQIIVQEQRAFFLGQGGVQPLRIGEVSQALGVHESTIYRALQGKYLYCDRGTFALSHFFPKELSGGTSSADVKDMIRSICEGNEKLSDQAIANELARRGVSLSRRTVAKYRAQLGIDSSYRRETKE